MFALLIGLSREEHKNIGTIHKGMMLLLTQNLNYVFGWSNSRG